MSNLYSISKMAKRVGVSISTLRRWDDSGQLVAKRHASGHRFYDESDVRSVLHIQRNELRKNIVYCRVSSANQKDDLASQVTAMEQFCLSRSASIDEWIEEIGGGMNFKRKKFLQLFNQISNGEVRTLYIAHKDRLVRFGFDLIEHTAKMNGCEIVVVNQQSLSPQQEMIEDLLAIVHTFSCRLYGLRSYKKKIKEVCLEDSSRTQD